MYKYISRKRLHISTLTATDHKRRQFFICPTHHRSWRSEMEFLSFDPKKKILALKKGDIPKPGGDEVLIKVAYAGICGTDLHILGGSFPCKQDGPLVLGHEFCGVVTAVGSAVKTITVGERVVVDPNSGCDTCSFCHSATYQFCQLGRIHKTIGIYRDGGWATHAVVPEQQVHIIPNGVNLQQAALAEPLSCLAHGWDRINPVHVGTRILVIGTGIIGSLWSCLLHLHGLKKTVTVSEQQEKRRELFGNLNLGYEIVSPSELEGREFDLAIDCSGAGPAIESALPLLGKGGRLCIFGIANPETKVSIKPYEVYLKELSIVGVNMNPFTFPKALALVEGMSETYLNYEKLGIGIFKLSEYEAAVAALKKGEISKAIFEF